MITTYVIPMVTNIIEYYIALLFFSNFLQKRVNTHSYFLVFLVGVAFSSALFQINSYKSPALNTIGIMLLLLIVVLLLYKASFILSIAFALIFVNISVASELLFSLILLPLNQLPMIDFYKSDLGYIAIGMGGKAFLLFIVIALIKRFQDKYFTQSSNDILMLIIFPILGISTTNVIFYLSLDMQLPLFQNLMLVLLEACLLVSGIIMFFIYDSAMYKRELEDRLRISQKAFEMNELIFKEQQRSIEADRANNHDFKFHLSNIKDLYQQGSSEAIIYHDKLIRRFEEAESINIINVNNHVISNIFERVRRQCMLNGINIDLQIKYNQLGFIDPIDACAVFDNAFDNAISACMQLESGRWIKTTLVKTDYYVIISILNSKSNQVIDENGKLLSTKRGYKASGYGVESIKAVAEKYCGDASMKFSENDFELLVRLKDLEPTL